MIFLGNVYSQNSWIFRQYPVVPVGAIYFALHVRAQSTGRSKSISSMAYVQDTWKVTQRLTVNVGLRWEPSLPPGMLNNAAYNFSFANMLAGITSKAYVNGPPGMSFPGDAGFEGLAGVKRQWNLLAPRMAIGYDPRARAK